MEKEIAIMMKNLGVTREEALEIITSDKEVDRGGNPNPLTKEQEKAAKAARKTSTGVYNFTKRERKPNLDKREIIEKLCMGISLLTGEPVSTTINVTNIEREIEFSYHGKKYKVTLSAPREKKE